MHSDTMTSRQRRAWALAALSAPVSLRCAGLAWNRVLSASLAVGALWALSEWAQRRTEMDAAQAIRQGAAGRVLLMAEAAWCILAAGRTASGAGLAFPESRVGLLSVGCTALVASMLAVRGERVGARFGALCAVLLAMAYGLLTLSAAPELRWEWCLPHGTAQDVRIALSGLFPALAAFLLPGQKPDRKPAAAALLLLPAALSLVTAGCLSPELAAQAGTPFYLLARSVSVSETMQRFEPLVSAALLLGFFCLTGLELSAAAHCLKTALGRALPAPGAILFSAVLAAAWLAPRVPEALWLPGASIFWAAIPLEAQLMVVIKKFRKN